jgi:histidinol-phosphate aminotransferase
MTYERENISRLAGYIPGEQPPDGQVFKLNTNENPYPPSQGVLEAISGVDGEALRRYPSPNAAAFRQQAAKLHGLEADQIIATNGGDELLRLVITVFCEPASDGPLGGLGLAEPTYSLYPVLADIADTPVVSIARGKDFSLPDDHAQQLNDAGCRLALVVNPHAPTGRLESLATLEKIAREFHGVLLIDEAYVDFADHDALALLDPAKGLNNVLLLRTLSKGYSLAGLRFGYGMGHADLIAILDKARDSYNTDVLSQAAATAALGHRDEAARNWQRVIDQRLRMTTDLEARGYEVIPSQTNFILATPPANGANAGNIYRRLKEQGILVRYFDQERLNDKLRITIGTPQQNDALLAALDQLQDQSN